MKERRQIALIVLDGWGHRDEIEDNAIAQAHTPFYDSLIKEYPHSLLDASEEDVGLPKGQIGNSEIGHMTIGSGRIIDTDLVRITKAMNAGEFLSNPAFVQVFEHVKKNNSTLHLMGLLSPGGIHSHEAHAHGILRAAKDAEIEKVAIHAFTDGRDTPPQSAASFLLELENLLEEIGIGYIATASGRFFAMDRDHNWDRLDAAKDAIFRGCGTERNNCKPSDVLGELYKDGVLDEHLVPIVFVDENGKKYSIEDNDGVIFFNYRPDRARMLAHAIAESAGEKNICFATLTEYNKYLKAHVAFSPMHVDTTLAAEISKAGLKQVHIAETEKYPHATYFLNGGREDPHEGEEHVMIESRKDVLTHDCAPEMRAKEIADAAITHIQRGTDFIFINFANADMVGHTANKKATIEAVETIDRELSRVITELSLRGGIACITADHGNAELNRDQQTGQMHTAHTLNKVPMILTQKSVHLSDGGLADIAPTLLSLYELSVPRSMTGKNLIS